MINVDLEGKKIFEKIVSNFYIIVSSVYPLSHKDRRPCIPKISFRRRKQYRELDDILNLSVTADKTSRPDTVAWNELFELQHEVFTYNLINYIIYSI